MTEFQPIPDPAGALEPPRRVPPTAVGAATPEPEPEPRPELASRGRIRLPRRSPLETVLTLAVGVPLLGVLLGGRALQRLASRR